MRKTQDLVFLGLLIATEIVLTRYCSIQTPTIRIGFGFIPLVLAAALYGPAVGGVAAMVADIMGMMIFPKGAYFPGFTISALVGGIIYGLVLYKKPKSIINFFVAVLIVTIIKDIFMNTYWLTILLKVPFNAIIFERLIKSTVMFFIQIVTLPIVWKKIGVVIQTSYMKN